MQNNEGINHEVARHIAEINLILDSITREAVSEVRIQVEQIRQILLKISRDPGSLYSENGTSVNGSQTANPALFDTENIVTRQFDFKDFQNIEIDCAFIFEITAGTAYHVSITANESLFDKINIAQSGDILKLSLKPVRFQARPILEAHIVMPNINRLRQSAATSGIVSGFRTNTPFDLYLSGASSTQVNIECGEARLEITGASHLEGVIKTSKADLLVSGASRVQLSGRCRNLVLSGWGAADMDMAEFQSEEGTIYLKGASTATVNIKNQLNIDLTGASHLRYLGSPTLSEVTLSGASVLDQSHQSK
jgi:hypothetical protein